MQARFEALRKYASAALINTSVGLLLIGLLYRWTASPMLTISISTLLGYAYSLATYHTIAFPGQRRSPPYLRYGVIYGLSLGLNSGLTLAVLAIKSSFWLAQLVALPIVVGVQWFGLNRWAFRP